MKDKGMFDKLLGALFLIFVLSDKAILPKRMLEKSLKVIKNHPFQVCGRPAEIWIKLVRFMLESTSLCKPDRTGLVPNQSTDPILVPVRTGGLMNRSNRPIPVRTGPIFKTRSPTALSLGQFAHYVIPLVISKGTLLLVGCFFKQRSDWQI